MKKVGIVMGSDSDMPVMSKAAAILDKLGVEYEMKIISAHREPDVFFEYAKTAEEKGFKVIIAGAGMAAHLPGMCAAIFPMPVIGIPMHTTSLGGRDSLYSIVQMPSGIPVATVAINGGANAGLLAAKILATSDPELLDRLKAYSQELKLAMIMDKHDTIGIDAVAMCVNDIACAGAEPLFFLDYIACGKNYPEKIAEIVSGVAEGCVQSGAALIGGETAEHPGLMPEDEYDLAGFAVGVIDKKDLLTGEELKPGDVLIGMASTGVHSNGFSLVRKVFEMTKESLDTYYDELGTTLGEALLAPTRIYVKALKSVKEAGVRIHACSHITGGGFYENVPRMLKDGTRAVIEKNSYPVLPIFDLLAKTGDIEEKMMYNTFNMGLGMVLAVDPSDVDKTMEAIRQAGDTPYVVGRIEAGEKGVTLC